MLRRKRRDISNALNPATLEVKILQPPGKLEVAPAPAASKAASNRWTQDMLIALAKNLVGRSGGATISADGLLAAILEQRSSGLRFDVDIVPPSLVLRSESALASLCSAQVTPAWGNVAVDITEFLLHLTFHERNISWP